MHSLNTIFLKEMLKSYIMKWIDNYFGRIILFLLKLYTFNKKTYTISESPKKILLINLVAMGDLIMMSAFSNSLKQSYPNTEIHLLTTTKMSLVVEPQNIYSKIFYLKFDFFYLWHLIKAIINLRTQKYEIIFETEFYYNITTIIAILAKPAILIGFDLQQHRATFFDYKIPFNENQNIAINYLNLGAPLKKFQKIEKLLPISFSQKDIKYVESLILNKKDFIIIHIGTSKQATSRRLPLKTWKTVIETLQNTYNIILVGDSEETAILKEINPILTTNTTNLIKKLSIPQLAYLCTLTKLYIGLDTGPTHLAASMGAKILSIYGPNTPILWGPYTNKAKVLYTKLLCSPCTKQYKGIVSKCKNNLCIQNITYETILDNIREYLSAE